MKKNIAIMIIVIFVFSTAVFAEKTENKNKIEEVKKVEEVESVEKTKNEGSETLLKGNSRNGYYGGAVLKITGLNNWFATLVGGRAAWIVNRNFAIGAAGYGMVNEVENTGFFTASNNVKIGYGGVFLESIVNSRKLVHFTIGALIGAGGVKQNERHDFNSDWDKTEFFFVVEPEINLMLNISKNFRMGLGLSYRYVSGVDCEWIRDADLCDFALGLSFKIGRF
ncbi:MAG: hypothetical protein GY757_00925 [bacterium]|nr:hypothetical protein [bacterium]